MTAYFFYFYFISLYLPLSLLLFISTPTSLTIVLLCLSVWLMYSRKFRGMKYFPLLLNHSHHHFLFKSLSLAATCTTPQKTALAELVNSLPISESMSCVLSNWPLCDMWHLESVLPFGMAALWDFLPLIPLQFSNYIHCWSWDTFPLPWILQLFGNQSELPVFSHHYQWAPDTWPESFSEGPIKTTLGLNVLSWSRLRGSWEPDAICLLPVVLLRCPFLNCF